MSLVEFVKVFMIIWLSGVAFACLASLYSIIFKNGLNSDSGLFMFIPFLMLIVGVVMIYFGFKLESKKSIKDLEEILKAKIIES